MRRRGFTLTEMLVVIGIVVLLLSLLSPMVARAWRAGDRTRTAADLQAIAAALEAYRQDHGTYPPVGRSVPPRPLAPNPASGAQVLCMTVVAPAPYASDGNDGPGFRVRAEAGPDGSKGTPDDIVGRVYGPYLPADRFKFADPTNPAETRHLFWSILDRNNRPILYYPAHGKPNVRVAGGFVKDWDYLAPPAPKYNARDNLAEMPEATLRIMLGDSNANGMIDAGETPKTDAAFILWSAGPDETFGPPPGSDLSAPDKVLKAVEKSDDVTSFGS